MFGCIFSLFTLPFKMIYWFIKGIWEISELISGHHRHTHHRRTHKRKINSKPVKKTMTSRQLKEAQRHDEEDDKKLDKMLDECLGWARNTGLSPNVRIDAYETALRAVDKMINRNNDNKRHEELLTLQSSLRLESANFITNVNTGSTK